MAVAAVHCPDYKIIVCDIDEKRIAAWNSDNLPLFEPNLLNTLQLARKNNNLTFTTDVKGAIKESSIIFVAVSTPTKTYGRGAGKAFDMTSWEAVSRTIGREAESDKIIVEKSTVPVRTAEKVALILEECKRDPNIKFRIVSNPEFLAEGSAVKDAEEPERVLIGGEKDEEGLDAVNQVADIYRQWIPEEKIILTNLWTSELSKLASNAFLAQRISTMNALSAICEVSGGDIEEVKAVLGMDSRIGNRYLSASVGFGGSCLKKDVLALVYISEHYQLHEVAEYWKSIVTINEFQKFRFANRILDAMNGTVRGKKISVFGFAFKKDTGDIRETSAVEVVRYLQDESADLHIYDPKVLHSDIHNIFPKVSCHSSPVEALSNSHALVLLTEWDEFKHYNYRELYNIMQKPAYIFDGRNILNHEELTRIGFHVYAIGKQSKYEHSIRL